MTARTFKNLIAGSTVIMGNGDILRFGGKPGGHGTYVTENPAEIAYLAQLAKSNIPNVWEETPEIEASGAIPDSKLAVATDTATAAADVAARAAVAVDPKVAVAVAKAGSVATGAAA